MTTMFLATTGGHLDELRELADRIAPEGPEVWVTHEGVQSRSVLHDRTVEFVPYVRVHSVPDVARCLPSAHRFWRRYDVHRVVSTGSGIALGYLPYLAARGVACHYIESAARVSGPSLTGRVLEGVPGVHRYCQYRWPRSRRWSQRSGVLDAYRPVDRAPGPGGALRVVVTVGTAREFPFERLVVPLARLLAPGGPLERSIDRPLQVLWQTGCTPVEGLPIRATPFVDGPTLSGAVAAADLVIGHAGAGTVLGALRAGKRPLVVGRRRDRGEIGDDHQSELATELRRRDLAAVHDPARLAAEDLLDCLGRAVRRMDTPAPLELGR